MSGEPAWIRQEDNPPESIVDALFRHAAEKPDAPFLKEGDQSWSYGEFATLVRRLARYLRERGLGYGDRLIIYLGRKSAHAAAYLATLSIGVIATHVYPEAPLVYVESAVKKVGASKILTLQGWDRPEGSCELLTWPEDLESLEPLECGERHPVAYLMFTSGTTSTPKAVITTQANLLAVTRNLIEMAGIRSGNREAIFMPLGSTGGSGHLHAHLLLGNEIRLLP